MPSGHIKTLELLVPTKTKIISYSGTIIRTGKHINKKLFIFKYIATLSLRRNLDIALFYKLASDSTHLS